MTRPRYLRALHRHISPTYAPHICNTASSRVSENHGTAAYVDPDAVMTESLIQTFVAGLLGALLAVELVLALTSFVESGGRAGSGHRTSLLMSRPVAIRHHFETRRFRLNALKRQYPVLRLPGHGRRVRDAVRRLHLTPLTAEFPGCPDCRGSRLRGLPRCPSCARRLIEPAHAAVA